MSTYRRKSTNVEVRALTEDDREAVVAWVHDLGVMTLDEGNGSLVLLQRRGTTRVDVGDLIVLDEVLGLSCVPADALDARFYSP